MNLRMQMAAIVLLALTVSAAVPAADSPSGDDAAAAGEAWYRDLNGKLAASKDPRERALAWVFGKGSQEPDALARRGHLLREAAEALPNDEVVQALWVAASESASGCSAAHPCPRRQEALARANPDNAYGWAWVVADAQRRGDEAAADAALARMAASRYYATPFVPTVRAWMDVFARYPPPDAVIAWQRQHWPLVGADRKQMQGIAAIAFAAAMTGTGVYPHCKPPTQGQLPAARRRDCQRVAQLMLQAPTLSDISMGNGLMHMAGGARDPGIERMISWRVQAMRVLDRDPREFNTYLDDLLSTGSEIEANDLLLQRRGLPLAPPADWTAEPFQPLPATPG